MIIQYIVQTPKTATEGVMKDLLGLIAFAIAAYVFGSLTYELWPQPVAWVLALLTVVTGFLPVAITVALLFSR